MKHRSFANVAFATGVLVLGFAAASPARANYSVVKFEAGYCRIWWDSGGGTSRLRAIESAPCQTRRAFVFS
jgi:hypothetical protein